MATRTIYCSACDRDVLVQQTSKDSLDDAVCLDIGEGCTGSMCPICARAPEAIRRDADEILRRPQQP